MHSGLVGLKTPLRPLNPSMPFNPFLLTRRCFIFWQTITYHISHIYIYIYHISACSSSRVSGATQTQNGANSSGANQAGNRLRPRDSLLLNKDSSSSSSSAFLNFGGSPKKSAEDNMPRQIETNSRPKLPFIAKTKKVQAVGCTPSRSCTGSLHIVDLSDGMIFWPMLFQGLNTSMTINKQFVSKFDGKSNNGIPTFTQLRASERALERAQKVGFSCMSNKRRGVTILLRTGGQERSNPIHNPNPTPILKHSFL